MTFTNVAYFRSQFSTTYNPDAICQVYPVTQVAKIGGSPTKALWGETPHDWFVGKPIAKNIHQTSKTSNLTPKMRASVQSFKDFNPSWKHYFYNHTLMQVFVQEYYPSMYPLFSSLPVTFQADIFRYLVIYERGGLYTEIDTTCLRPIHDWMGSCQAYQSTTEPISAIIAVECESGGCHRQPQISQSTFIFAARHPLLKFIIDKVLLKVKATQHFKAEDAAEITGPGTWTDAIFEYFATVYGLVGLKRDGFPTETKKLLGDILILTKSGFNGANVKHGFVGPPSSSLPTNTD